MVKPSRPVTALLGVVFGLSLPASFLLNPVITDAAPAPAPVAQVVLTPNTGTPDTLVTVKGSHYKAHETVDVYLDVTAEAVATTTSTGTFQTHLTVPASATPGAHWISAVGQSAGPTAEAAFTVNVDWTAFREGPLHNGVNLDENVINPSNVGGLTEEWSRATSDQVESSPIVVDGVVYVGSDDDKVYALNADDGTVIWSVPTGGSVFSSPAEAGGIVYVGSEDGKVYAINASTGHVNWTFNTGFPVKSSPAVVGGVVYIGSYNDKVYALNASNGNELWSYTTGGAIYSSPAVANGVVYVGSLDGNVYAIAASNGLLDWSYPTLDVVYSSPAVAGGLVYVGSFDGNVYALNASTGLAEWVYPTGNAVNSSPAVDNGVVYIGSDDGNLYALDASTGLVDWSKTTGGGVASSPVVANGVVYVGSNDDNAYAYDASTGDQLWNFTTGDGVFSSLAVADGAVYVGSDDKSVYAFSTPPVVGSTYPADGATAVLATVHPSVTFDEAVNLLPGAFTLECPVGTPESFTVAPASPGGGATYTLTPSAPLPAGVVCTVTVIASQVSDPGGVGMVANFSFSFTIDTPPVIVSTFPLDGATAVLASADPSVTFNKAVNVSAGAFTLACPVGHPKTFTLSPTPPGGATTFTLTPSAPLPAGIVCTVTVVASHVADIAGTFLVANDVFSFTVDTPPTVVSTDPANKAKGVLASVDPTVTFNKAVNITASSFTLDCPAHTARLFTVSPAAPGGVAMYTLTPSAPLPAGLCTVTVVASQVTDLAGTTLAKNYVFSFTVGGVVDTPPVVASTSPANGATGVSRSAAPRVTFNKAVHVGPGAFTLACPTGTPEVFTLSPPSPGGVTTYTLTPSALLPAHTVCTVTVVAAEVADLAGTPMAHNYMLSFTVASSGDTAPVVASTNPSSGATKVSIWVDPTITFNKAVNVGAGAFTFDCPSGTPVAFTLSPSAPGGATTYTLTPVGPLPTGTVCVITVVASQVTDLAGTHMASNYVFSFKTGGDRQGPH